MANNLQRKEHGYEWFLIIFTSLILMGAGAFAEIRFDSGSDGSDGALIFEAPETETTIDFDPTAFDPPLDPDGDNVYHFTTIYIPSGN